MNADPPNSVQLEGTPTILPTYIQVHAVVWECGEGQTHTHMAVTTIHFASATPRAKCNKSNPMPGSGYIVTDNQSGHVPKEVALFISY